MLAAILSLPVSSYAFGKNPPLNNTSSPGQGTCASCHGTLTAGSGVTVTAPSSYTPGGAAVPITVTIPTSGGYELDVLTQSGNAQAGALAAGTNSGVSTVGAIQFVFSTVETTSWTFNWTPPATNVGNVVLYVAGGGHSPNFSNNQVMTPAAATGTAPSITSANSAAFTVGTAGTFKVTATGTPAPTLSESGALPAGVTFTAGTLSGTPTASGSFPITFTAANGTTPNATQSFTLTVNPAVSVNHAPAITSANSTTFTVGTAGTFMMMATGTPTPTLGETGTLPAGVTFSASTGVLSGTPTVSGTFSITFAATNGITPNASQSFTLTVNPAVTTTGALAASPSSLSFNYQMGGGTPSSRTLAITSTGGSTSYTATETDPWLSIAPKSGTNTPASISASVNPSGMAPGSYGAQINITAANGKTITIPVALTITSGSGGGDGGGGTPGNMNAQPFVSDPQSGALAAAWVDNMGTSPHNGSDPHNRALVLSKGTSASTNSWAGANIQNVTGMSLTELGFDFRAGIQCSTDAVHFLITTTDGTSHTLGGCTSSAVTAQSTAPTGWMRLRFDPGTASPAINPNDHVQSISLVLDKGSIAVIDNIYINNAFTGKGSSNSSSTSPSRSRDD
jgi:hypothetical protein